MVARTVSRPGRVDTGAARSALTRVRTFGKAAPNSSMRSNLSASRAIGRTVEVFVGVQNAFDAEYFVGTLPTTLGSPRLVTVGLRVRLH